MSDSTDQSDYCLSDYERKFIWVPSQCWDFANARPTFLSPRTVDRSFLSRNPVANQGRSDTCVSYALTDTMQLLWQRTHRKKITLSAAYAHWIFKNSEHKPWCDGDFRLASGVRLLIRQGVCLESLCQSPPPPDCNPPEPSPAAHSGARYGISGFFFIDRNYVWVNDGGTLQRDQFTPGVDRPDVTNTAYLECLLATGYDIVLAIIWDITEPGKGPWPVRRTMNRNFSISTPIDPSSSHTLVITGYRRDARTPYFICRNSSGAGSNKEGLTLLTYDYVRTYALYGLVLLGIRDDL